jgi:para-nitrobenzyl esterase
MRLLLLLIWATTCTGCGDDSSAAPEPDAAFDAGTDAGPPPEIEVTYDHGTVVGRTVDGVHTFLGIPYAAPPLGELRWRPPQPVEPWTTPRDAGAVGAICPQINALVGSTTLEGDEDCLFVNVFTPDVAPAEPRPVFVWIHGGAFVLGSGGRSPGRLAAVSQTVVVSLNYRLDQLGFMAHPALTAEGDGSGNWGLLDQRAAMAWVRDHIPAFGGDPGNVTIAGESAGGVSVNLHGVAPGSHALFHRAIVQSGPPGLLPLSTLAEAEASGMAVADRVGCTEAATAASCLRGTAVEELVVAADLRSGPGGLFYQPGVPVPTPNLDGTTLVEDPGVAYAAGRFATVPWLVGSNGDEGTLFHSDLTSVPVANEAEYRAAVANVYPDDVDAIVAQYPVASYADANEALTAVTGALFNCGTRRFARWLSDGGAATWLYAFEAVPDGLLVETYDLGSVHGGELVYLFDLTDGALGTVPPDERELVDAMQGYWTRFAASGDPNGEGAPVWPSYETSTDRHLLLVDPPSAGERYLEAECDFWDGILAP